MTDSLQIPGEDTAMHTWRSRPRQLWFEAPLTEPQTEILFAAQFGPDASCAFHESVSVELHGELSFSYQGEALDQVVARHESLRAGTSRGLATMTIEADQPVELAEGDCFDAACPACAS